MRFTKMGIATKTEQRSTRGTLLHELRIQFLEHLFDHLSPDFFCRFNQIKQFTDWRIGGTTQTEEFPAWNPVRIEKHNPQGVLKTLNTNRSDFQ